MKKWLTIKLALLIGLITSIHPVSVNAAKDEYLNFDSLEEKYYEILKNKESYSLKGQAEEISESNIYTSDFSVFNLIDTQPNAVVIEEREKDNKKEAIINDSANDVLMYAKVIDDNHMKMIIEGTAFEIVADENNIYCISSSGGTLSVLETEYEDSIEELTHYIDNTYSARSASWVLVTQHLKGTNTLLLQAISEISTVGGAVAWTCGNALFGSIFTISGLFSYVGQKLTVTLYTDYDRYYRSDCTTYIRDYIRFYQYNNYTGYVGAGYSYFHSVRPDYSGQNCLAYA